MEVQFDRVLMIWEFQGAGRLIQKDVAGDIAFAFTVYGVGGIRFLRPLFGLESRIPGGSHCHRGNSVIRKKINRNALFMEKSYSK